MGLDGQVYDARVGMKVEIEDFQINSRASLIALYLRYSQGEETDLERKVQGRAYPDSQERVLAQRIFDGIRSIRETFSKALLSFDSSRNEERLRNALASPEMIHYLASDMYDLLSKRNITLPISEDDFNYEMMIDKYLYILEEMLGDLLTAEVLLYLISLLRSSTQFAASLTSLEAETLGVYDLYPDLGLQPHEIIELFYFGEPRNYCENLETLTLELEY